MGKGEWEIKQKSMLGEKGLIDWENVAKVMQKINCKNIVRIMDYFEDESFRYIGM